MTSEDADDPLVGSRPAMADSPTTPPSRSLIGLQPILALAVGCGVLWWIVHTMLSNTHDINEAIRAMKSRNASERVGGIQRLKDTGQGNGQMAIPALIVALGDVDAHVRSAAAGGLGSIGTDALESGSLDDMVRGAMKSLLGALKDPEPSVRIAASNALASIISSEKSAGLFDPKTALITFTESLRDRDAGVRDAALGPLTLLAPASGVDPPQELADVLKDESAGTRARAVVALLNFGRGLDPWIPSLLQMIEKDKDPAIQEAFFRTTVARIHPPAVSAAVIPTLIAGLRSPVGQVRDIACRVLVTFGPEAHAAVPALIAMAREEWSDSTVVERQVLALDRSAIEALSKIALKTESAGQVIAVLTELIQETSPNRCAAAVAALGEFGPAAESAVPALVRALPWKLPPINRPLADPPVVIKALGRIATGPNSVGKIIAGLGEVVRTGSPDMQWDAADALGGFGPAAESAVPDLILAIGAVREKPGRVTWRACVALGRIAPRTKSAGEAIAALDKLLRIRPDKEGFQIAAADALADFGPAAESAVPDLIQVLKESSGDEGGDRQAMSSAARALVRIAPGTPSSEEAMRALTEALPRLRAIAKDRSRPVTGAEEALAKIEGRK